MSKLSVKSKLSWKFIDILFSLPSRIAITDDGRTIVCYHPASKHEFPYEYTKPLPKVISADEKFKHSILDPQVCEKNQPAIPMTEEDLIRLTYRPRSVWKNKFTPVKRNIEPKVGEIDRPGIWVVNI